MSKLGKVAFSLGLAVFCIPCGANFAGADEQPARDESSWASLVDEPSRGDLFQTEILPAAVAEADAIAKAEGREGVSLGIVPTFSFPADVGWDKTENKARSGAIFGIDVSHYTDAALHLELLKGQEVKFIYLKATQGTGWKDDNFRDFWPRLAGVASTGRDGVKRDGVPAESRIPRGAFHFLSSTSPGSAQADSFVDYVTLHGGFKDDDLPPVVDLEWDVTKTVKDQWVGKGADAIVKSVLDCLARIKERTHRTPILYTARSWWSAQTIPLSRFSEFKDYPIWIADYSTSHKLAEKPADLPGGQRVIWQFTDRSLAPQIGIASVKNGLDASIFYGTEEDFRTAFGLPH
jgi:lysozyme